MKITILSDLHLGIKGDPSNNFLIDENIFSQYLKSTLDDSDLLILNGDTFELWENIISPQEPPTIVGMLRSLMIERMERIVASWKFMPEILNNPKILLINGNHDSLIRTDHLVTTKLVTNSLRLNLIGRKLYFAHGHQCDFYKSPLCFVSCSVSNLVDLFDPELDQNLEKLTDNFNLVSTKKVTQYANTLAQKLPCDVVIFGHTHKSCLIKTRSRYYINSGCVVGKKEVIDEVVITSDDDKRTVNLSCHQIHVTTRTILNPLVVNI
jgi:UDP-2,3-diacylglucosamine pyrophosphatase LpxH